MALSSDLEARIHAAEEAAKDLFDECDKLAVTLDGLSSDQIAIPPMDDPTIDDPLSPDEEWEEDPSLVRHIEALQSTADRVRRESADPALMPIRIRASTDR